MGSAAFHVHVVHPAFVAGRPSGSPFATAVLPSGTVMRNV